MKKNLPGLSLVAATLLAILVVPLVFGAAAVAKHFGPLAAVAGVLALFTLPTCLGWHQVWGVYPNKLRIEGLTNSYMADPDGSTIGVNLRCKLVADAVPLDGTPVLQLASDSERGSVVTLQIIAAGSYGACAFSNGSGGSLIGVCASVIASGGAVYAAANGKVAATGSLLLGVCEIAGAVNGTCVYVPNPVAA